MATAATAHADSPEALRAKYSALQDRLSNNPFKSPLTLDSTETAGSVAGEIYAVMDYPFAKVGPALNNAAYWCDILILHLNTKYCRAVDGGKTLNVSIGKKFDQPLDDAYRVIFAWRVTAQTANYLQVQLSADEGPLSTRDYRIVLEAVSLENGQTFIHLSYAYGYGVVGRIAMQAYLGTIGANKVGFTVAARQSDGQPVHIGGMRGLVERFGGKRAGWDDFRRGFEKATGRDLERFFTQWIDRTGLPDLALSGTAVARVQTGFRVTGRVVQGAHGGKPYMASVPVIIDTAQGPKEFEVDVTAAENVFSLDLDSMPVEIRLDPDMNVPRHLVAREIPPCLNAVVESDRSMIVVPDAVTGRPEDPYMQIARRIGESKGVSPAASIGEEDSAEFKSLLRGVLRAFSWVVQPVP